MKFYNGVWGIQWGNYTGLNGYKFHLMLNEGGAPINLTIGKHHRDGWSVYFYFFGKRFYRNQYKP